MTLAAYKKSEIKLFERFHAESMVLCCSNAFDPSQISRYTANEIEISLNDLVQIKTFSSVTTDGALNENIEFIVCTKNYF